MARTLLQAPLTAVQRGKAFRNQCVNKSSDIIARVGGYVVTMGTELLKDSIYGVFPVHEFPQADTGGVEPKTVTGIRIEEHSPVVKLLPEQDEGIGYRLFIIVHQSIRVLSEPYPPLRSPTRLTEPVDTLQAMCHALSGWQTSCKSAIDVQRQIRMNSRDHLSPHFLSAAGALDTCQPS
jgi:hypothetical protein